ncbi:hypothetical protein, partial [Erwinia aphidicola]|uniref:hypothetical protein n=1 Tax=Erwinia aphidicola TaxID=68334 RepID=UPI003017F0A6
TASILNSSVNVLTDINTPSLGLHYEAKKCLRNPGLFMSLRRMLEADVGAETARRILGRFFPNGSAEKVIAHRQRTAGETGGESVIRALATELINQQGYDL